MVGELVAGTTTGAAVTGLPVTGLPVTGLSVTGLPVTGLSVTGLPVTGAGVEGRVDVGVADCDGGAVKGSDVDGANDDSELGSSLGDRERIPLGSGDGAIDGCKSPCSMCQRIHGSMSSSYTIFFPGSKSMLPHLPGGFSGSNKAMFHMNVSSSHSTVSSKANCCPLQ